MKFVILQALAHLHFLPTHFLMISPMFFGEHLLTTLLANISHLKHGLWNHKASNHGRRCADGSLQPELAMLTPGPADLVRNILHTRASIQTRSSSTLPLLIGGNSYEAVQDQSQIWMPQTGVFWVSNQLNLTIVWHSFCIILLGLYKKFPPLLLLAMRKAASFWSIS